MNLLALLEELRILAQNGVEYADNSYDQERYERIVELTAEWYRRSVDLPSTEVQARFAEEVGIITPKVSADAAVFDEDGRILLQLRADDNSWCLPGGYTKPNESPQETAVRETREETGLITEPIELVGVTTRKPGDYGPHCLVAHLYLCTRTGGELAVSHEGHDLRYWSIDQVSTWHKNHYELACDAYEVWQNSVQETKATE